MTGALAARTTFNISNLLVVYLKLWFSKYDTHVWASTCGKE